MGIGENANLGKQSVFNNKTVIWDIITLLSGLDKRLCLILFFFTYIDGRVFRQLVDQKIV